MLTAAFVEEYHVDPDGMILRIYDHLDGTVTHEVISSELETAVKLSEAASVSEGEAHAELVRTVQAILAGLEWDTLTPRDETA